MSDWLMTEIANGMKRIYVLNLPRTPAAEALPLVAASWRDGIARGRAFEETRDAPRIRAAFSTLVTTAREWPAPHHLISAMPPVPQVPRLTHKRTADPARVARHLANIRAVLGLPPGDPLPPPPKSGRDLAAGDDD